MREIMAAVSINHEKNTLPTLPMELFLEICDLLYSCYGGIYPVIPIASAESVRALFSEFGNLRGTSKNLKEKCDEILKKELDRLEADDIPERFRVIRFDMTDHRLGHLEAIAMSSLFAPLIESVEYEAIDLTRDIFDKEGFDNEKSLRTFLDNYYYCVDFFDQHQENLSKKKDRRILKVAFKNFVNLKQFTFRRIHVHHSSFNTIRRAESSVRAMDSRGTYLKPEHDMKALLHPWYWAGIFNIAKIAMQNKVAIPSLSFEGLVPDLSLTPEDGRKALGWLLRRCEKLRMQCRADYGGAPLCRNGFQADAGQREIRAWREFLSCAKHVTDLELSADNNPLLPPYYPQPCKLLSTILSLGNFNQLGSFHLSSAEFRTTDIGDFLTRHRYTLWKIGLRGYPWASGKTAAESWMQVFAVASRLVWLEEAEIFVDHDDVAGGRNKGFPKVLSKLTDGKESKYNFGEYVLDQKDKIWEVDDGLLAGFVDLGKQQALKKIKDDQQLRQLQGQYPSWDEGSVR